MSKYTENPKYKARIDRNNAKYLAKTKEERALKQRIYRNRPEVKERYAEKRKLYYQNNKDKFFLSRKYFYYPNYKQNIELDDIIDHEELIKNDDNALTTEFMLELVLTKKVNT